MSVRISRILWLGLVLGSLIVLGCGNAVEQSLIRLAKGGGERETALMDLALMRDYAIPRLVSVLDDPEKSVGMRGDTADILFRMHIRGSDARIMPALLRHIDNEIPEIRARIAWSLGSIGEVDALHPLLERFQKEEDPEVLREILGAIQIIDRWEQKRLPGGDLRLPGREQMTEWRKGSLSGRDVFWMSGGRHMTEDERARFVERLKVLREDAADSELQALVAEFLEAVAQQLVEKADRAILRADLSGAEAMYLEARGLVPESKNVNRSFGKFYLDNISKEKGLEVLRQHGMVIDAPRLRRAPLIDGDLSDPSWRDAAKITEFYQCIRVMRTVPAEGVSEVYIGYTARDLYVAVKGYEASTKDLAAVFTERDKPVWRDDNADVLLDTNLDYSSFYHIVVNSIGTIADYAHPRKRGYWEKPPEAWDSACQVATKVEETFWTLEMRIPFEALGVSDVGEGDIWGLNVARVRVAHKGEYDQWVPTYGYPLRPERLGFLVFN